MDLFAGIGGVRLGFEAAKGVCVFSSEFDAKAQLTYKANHGDFPFGDITKITEEDSNNIPDHDVLLGGFPCQAFSIAGYRQGFDDEKGRGNLFLNIHEILKVKKPKAFLLENVKNLQGHDGGKTFKIIKTSLEELGYSVIHKVMNSMEYGNVPQTRERIYIVGFKDEVGSQPGDNTDTLTAKFKWPETEKLTKTIRTVLESNVDDQFYYEKYACHEKLAKEMTREDTVYQWRRHYVRENKSNVCPTLTANMGTGGHNVPLILDENRRIRKLTPRECSYVQGFPDSFVIPKGIANSHLYKQFGNSVTVPVIKKIALEIERLINL
ncbi:DNA (cytosine-5-)-methyltransferase [Vibrio breoganii]|nr:DNA (cytosine-5-)-methyltransferase [Vibrio breoganii]